MLNKLLWLVVRKLPIKGVTIMFSKSDGKRHRHVQATTTDSVFGWVNKEASERGWTPSTVIHYHLLQAKLRSEDNSHLMNELEQEEAYRTYMSYSNEKSPSARTDELGTN